MPPSISRESFRAIVHVSNKRNEEVMKMSSVDFGRWGAPAAMVGGAMWALFPFGTSLASIEKAGTSAYAASVAYYGLMAVAPLLLLMVGLAGIHAAQRGAYGRLGRVGFPVSILALGLMFAGNGVEVASLTFRGSESAVGHFAFLIGFLILLIGSALVGLAVWRTRRDAPARFGSSLLMGALPLGIFLAVVFGSLVPESDLGFWAAIAIPSGVAWVVLGRAFRDRPVEPAGQPARVS
jgi:vacuolar-type H+-ATPase subunit I/STV1